MDPARAKSYLMELSRQRQTIRRLNEQLTEIQARMGASSPRLQEEHVRKSRVYVQEQSAAEAAAQMGITYRHAMRIHAAALEAFAELLPLQEQEK